MALIIRKNILAATPPPPVITGYPDASNTGVPPGTVLTTLNGTLFSTSDGQVFQNLLVNGAVEIWHNNVTIRRCKIVNRATPYHCVRVMNDNLTGFLMEDCEVDANCVNGFAAWGTFRRINVYNCNNGINFWGPGTAVDCYIHGLMPAGDASPHYDGVEINGGADILVDHCNVICDYTQTSAIQINNYFSKIERITIQNSRIIGGGYTAYVDWRFTGETQVDISTIRFLNNRFGIGFYGYLASYGKVPVWSGNVDDVTGLTIGP